jgi:hypothetical protein
VVERRPEKAGVASSILAPGTTRSRNRFIPKEIYVAQSLEAACKGCFGFVRFRRLRGTQRNNPKIQQQKAKTN